MQDPKRPRYQRWRLFKQIERRGEIFGGSSLGNAPQSRRYRRFLVALVLLFVVVVITFACDAWNDYREDQRKRSNAEATAAATPVVSVDGKSKPGRAL